MNSEQPGPVHARKTLTRRISTFLVAVFAAVILIAAGMFLVESLRMQRLARVMPPGAIYKVDGYDVHMLCTGAGSPTILLEAGLGDDFLSWRRVQPALSRVTRVCSYDRAGYGWSASRPGPRDTEHIADELKSLLTVAHIDGPIILMGHSAGGLFLRNFATRYPANIVAMVFVDSSTPTQVERLPQEFRMEEDFTWDKLLLPFGITRARQHCGVTDATTPEMNSELAWHDCRQSVFATTEREEKDFPASASEAKATGPYGNIPVLIFSQDPAMHFGELPFPLTIAEQGAAAWNTLQEELKNLSPRSRRIIARGSTHYVHQLRPELVISEVSHLVGEARGSEPQRKDYGSTSVQ